VNKFLFAMAWRETRGGWQHFLYFFVCIAVGVGTLVAVSLFAANVERAVMREARGLLGGDLEVRLSHPLSAKGQDVLTSLTTRGITTTHVSELIAMAARVDQGGSGVSATQIAELKAVEQAYPLYGTIRLEPTESLDTLLHPDIRRCGGTPCFGAVVQESLLVRMGLSVGERLKIGQALFVITGIVRTEPDRMANAFSLGPRVLISRDGLSAAELIKPGSRVRERYLLTLPANLSTSSLIPELRGRLATDSVRVSGYQDAQPQLKQFLQQLTRYLGLIGLTALFIGGLGVATSIHAFLREKLQTIAILKTAGADSATVIKAYALQAMWLGLVGSLAGAAIGIGLQRGIPTLVTNLFASDLLDQLGFSPELSMSSLWPVVKGVVLGLLSTLLFALWPLLTIRNMKPAAILRRDVEPMQADDLTTPRQWQARWGLCDRLKLFTACGFVVGLAGLSVWQAESWRIGLLFVGALVMAVVFLALSAKLLVFGLRLLPIPKSLSLRQALSNVARPGGQVVGIMVAIGIGVMAIATVSLVEHALLQQVGDSRPSDAPTFFFIDIQPDQADGFVQIVHQQLPGRKPDLTPLVRSRLHAINGETIKIDSETEQEEKKETDKQEQRKNWYATREYVLTFLDQVPKDNTIVKGEWWKQGEAFAKPQLSVEEEAAKHLGLDVGSTVDLDIQGAIVSAEVRSIRKVEWGSFSTNFYMILSPGSLDGAPVTYVATLRVLSEEEVPIQQAVVASFPNVSAIHVGDVLQNFARVLDRLSLAIRAVASFCVLAGGLVMAAALAATRYRRLYESVILKALGATRGLVARSFAAEYALLGGVAGLIGILLGSLLSWAVLTYFFELAWSLQPSVLLIDISLTVLLTLAVGFLSTYRLLGQRPLAVLRHE
jgi:putative ABC transport system permease protein